MKSVIKICNMTSEKDVKLIQDNLVRNDGVIATQVSLVKKELTVIYNDNVLNSENIIDLIEDLGYIVT